MHSKALATLALAALMLGGCSSWNRDHDRYDDRGGASPTMDDPSEASPGNTGPGYPPTGR